MCGIKLNMNRPAVRFPEGAALQQTLVGLSDNIDLILTLLLSTRNALQFIMDTRAKGKRKKNV